MWKPGDVLVNRHYSTYMVREGDPFNYDDHGVLIPDPPGFRRRSAIQDTGMPHLGSLSPEHWYRVNVFWWWLRVAIHRLNYWDLKTHKNAKPGNPSWYLIPLFYVLHLVAWFMPGAPETGSYFKHLLAKHRREKQSRKATREEHSRK